MMTRHGVLRALPANRRDRFMALAREVSFPEETRIAHEGTPADRFWIIHTGNVARDINVPGRRPVVVETIGMGELLGWSWLFPPRLWHLGAEATSPVRAWEFDANAVRELCDEDPVLGRALITYIAHIVADRLMAARTRLVDLYGPYGTGAVR